MTLKEMYTLLDFLTKHAGSLSVALTAVLALIVFFLVARAMVNSTGDGRSLGSHEELEKLLKTLMERTQGTLGQLGAPGVNSEDGQRLQADLERLQKELEEKNQQIQELNQKNSSFSIEEHNALKNRLQELEAKLAEYEIIAEDIADLSRYREENQDLKKKIEELEKRAQVAETISSGSASRAEAPPPVSVDSVDTSLLGNVEVISSGGQSGEVAATDALIDDALLAEFAAAVEEQKRAQKSASEMNLSVTQSTSDPESEMSEPMMDFEDLENEAQNLTELKVTDTLKPEEIFETQIDTERLSGEAQALSPKDEARELLGEFEKFVDERKGG
jgi:DNA repair exonuclease SbcCD ATPase subunit